MTSKIKTYNTYRKNNQRFKQIYTYFCIYAYVDMDGCLHEVK